MQFGKIGKLVAAGSLASLMMGATIGFATLESYPSPFVTSAGVQSVIVVGSQATGALSASDSVAGIAQDIAGAINIAARLGSEVTTTVSAPGVAGILAISGEGKAVATSNKKVFVNDTLGKNGLRNTITKDDLPTLLADGTLNDADASSTHKYTQFIKLTPGSSNRNSYALQFEKPGDSSASSEDPTYSFGEFSQSPSDSEWFYQTQIIFDKEVNGTTAVGEKLMLFGGEYTIDPTTTFVAGGANNKLVLAGGSQSNVLYGGEAITVTIGGNTYAVTLVGTSSTGPAAIVKVGSDQNSVTQGATVKIGGLDVYADRVFHLGDVQSANSAKLLLGANRLILQQGSKVKFGTDETTIQGTLVNLTVSSGKLASFSLYSGGESSAKDFLKLGGNYPDPVWKSFSVAFPSISEAPTASSRGIVKIEPSSDNYATVNFADDKSQTQTINWAYKATSSATTFSLADNNGDKIIVVEGQPVKQNQYFVVDGGDYPHMFELTSLTADGSASASLDIRDVFSGVTTRVNLGADNDETKVIDGQTYYIHGNSTAMNIFWGAGAANGSAGSSTTVFPRIKTNKGAYVALTEPTGSSGLALVNNSVLQLPTGAVSTSWVTATNWTFSATTNEDGTSTVGSSLPSGTTISTGGTFTLGKTAIGGLIYNISASADGSGAVLKIVGGSGTVGLTGPAVVFVEEEDDNKDIYTITTTLGTEPSGSNQQASISTVSASDPIVDTSLALGSDSNNYATVDRFGTYIFRTSSGQDKVWLYYPDQQVTADIAVLVGDATASSGGSSGGSVKQAVPIKSSIATTDRLLAASDKTNKHLILVGGPAVNSLVSDLATAGKTKNRDWYISQGQGTAIINLVPDAFAAGKSALVVAGHSASDTSFVTGVLQRYDTYSSDLQGKNLVVYKNQAISSSLSA